MPQARHRQAVRFYTNGKRANDRYALEKQVGNIVRRTDRAKQRAIASTARKASPMAKALLTSYYGIAPSYLNNRIKARVDADTLRVDASVLRFPLVLFRGKWGGPKTAGATASVLLASPKTYTHAFISPGRFAGRRMPLIYTRIPGKRKLQTYGRYKGKQREPIVVNRGPSTRDMILGRERDQQGNDIPLSLGTAPDTESSLRLGLISFYVGELKRLYAVEARGNG